MHKVDRGSIEKKKKKKWKMSKSDHERIIEDGIPFEFFLLNCPTIYSLWIKYVLELPVHLKLKIELLLLFVQVFAHVQIVLVQARALVSTESSFSIHVH